MHIIGINKTGEAYLYFDKKQGADPQAVLLSRLFVLVVNGDPGLNELLEGVDSSQIEDLIKDNTHRKH